MFQINGVKTHIQYTLIPLPFYDIEDQQWKPSVKELVNGEFERWQVFDLGFDEARFAMPYARLFATEIAAWRKASIDHWTKEQREKWKSEE